MEITGRNASADGNAGTDIMERIRGQPSHSRVRRETTTMHSCGPTICTVATVIHMTKSLTRASFQVLLVGAALFSIALGYVQPSTQPQCAIRSKNFTHTS